MNRKITRAVYKQVKSLLAKGYTAWDVNAVLASEPVGALSAHTISNIKTSKNRKDYLRHIREVKANYDDPIKYRKGYKAIYGVDGQKRSDVKSKLMFWPKDFEATPIKVPLASIVSSTHTIVLKGKAIGLNQGELKELVDRLTKLLEALK